MEIERVEKPVRKLRKLLKSLPRDPAPEEVHKLRTGTRRIEAVAAALEPAGGKKTRRLLKAIKPVRKAAGDVRDMDVLTSNLLHLPQNGHSDSLVRLIEHLAATRNASAGDLLDTVERQRKPARRELKKYAQRVETAATGKKPVQREVARTLDSGSGAGSSADELTAELAHWPALNSNNLHEFRLKVKETRYVLQAFPEANPAFVEGLGQVKDEIGDWHDWQQLLEIAREVLDQPKDRGVLAEIERITQRKQAHALAAANRLRQKFLHPVAARRRASR